VNLRQVRGNDFTGNHQVLLQRVRNLAAAVRNHARDARLRCGLMQLFAARRSRGIQRQVVVAEQDDTARIGHFLTTCQPKGLQHRQPVARAEQDQRRPDLHPVTGRNIARVSHRLDQASHSSLRRVRHGDF
jgi:hypothetical protein